MKRLKQNQLGHFCSYCPPKTTRAVYRTDGWTSDQYSCNSQTCKDKLTEFEKKVRFNTLEHLTEADHQTWLTA